MTLPRERGRAVTYAGELLAKLLLTEMTPGVPKAIREEARRVLRHYPFAYDVERWIERDETEERRRNRR